jgi:hypothetical protein
MVVEGMEWQLIKINMGINYSASSSLLSLSPSSLSLDSFRRLPLEDEERLLSSVSLLVVATGVTIVGVVSVAVPLLLITTAIRGGRGKGPMSREADVSVTIVAANDGDMVEASTIALRSAIVFSK